MSASSLPSRRYSIELSDAVRQTINDLIRESGAVCIGVRGDYLVFSTRADARDDLQKVFEDILNVISGAEVPAEVREIRESTRGIQLIWS